MEYLMKNYWKRSPGAPFDTISMLVLEVLSWTLTGTTEV
jgi:hypothetical protein